MDYRPWLSVIEIIYWGFIILSCLSVLLRERSSLFNYYILYSAELFIF